MFAINVIFVEYLGEMTEICRLQLIGKHKENMIDVHFSSR